MTLRTLLASCQIAAACAYGLLAFHLYRSGRFQSLAAFTLYCLAMAANTAWSPMTIRTRIWIDPALLMLRFAVVIEAACLISESIEYRKRRHLLLALLCAGGLVGVRSFGYFEVRDAREWYYSARQMTSLALAFPCLALAAIQWRSRDAWWDPVWLPHFRLVGAYMVGRALVSFLYAPGAGWRYWSAVRVGWLVGVCAWAALWGWYDREELRAPRFERLDMVT